VAAAGSTCLVLDWGVAGGTRSSQSEAGQLAQPAINRQQLTDQHISNPNSHCFDKSSTEKSKY